MLSVIDKLVEGMRGLIIHGTYHHLSARGIRKRDSTVIVTDALRGEKEPVERSRDHEKP